MRFIVSLIILALAVFGGYKFVTENVDFDDGIKVKQSFKDDMGKVGEKAEGWFNTAKDFIKDKF